MAQNKKDSAKRDARREWQDIQQAEHRRTTTGVARKRKWLRIGRWAASIALALAIVAGVVYSFKAASNDVSAFDSSELLDKVTFRTNGVLTSGWLYGVIGTREAIPTSSQDLERFRQMIEKEGQIKSAKVTLRLPDRVIVEVMEYTPLMKAKTVSSSGKAELLFISREGHIYKGYNYPVNTARALPYIAGVTLKKSANGAYKQLVDLEPVAILLDKARVGWPRLYADWSSVSLSRYKGAESPVSFVEVQSRTMGTIVFSVHSVEYQLRCLEKLVNEGVGAEKKRVVRIDLSIPDNVSVEFEKSTSNKSRR